MQRFVWCSYHIPDVPDELQNVEWMTKDVGNPGERFVITQDGLFFFTERGNGSFVRMHMAEYTGEFCLHRNSTDEEAGYDVLVEVDNGKLSMIRCIGKRNHFDLPYEALYDVHVHAPMRALDAVKLALKFYRFLGCHEVELQDDFYYHCRAFLKDTETIKKWMDGVYRLCKVPVHAWLEPRDGGDRVDLYFGGVIEETKHVTE